MAKTLLREEVKKIIDNRPDGTEPRDVVKGLLQRGYDLQGLNNDFSDSRQGTEFLPKSVQKVSEFGQGAIKQAIENIVDTGNVGEKILSGTLRTIFPKSLEEKIGLNRPTSAEQIKQSEKFKKGVERDSNVEKIGATVEEILEFFIPVPGGKAAKLGTKINELKGLSKLSAKAGREALDIGVRGTLQEGEFNKDILTASAIGAGIPVVGSALGKLAQPVKGLVESLPNRFIESVLGRNKKQILAEMDKDASKSLVNFLKSKPVKTTKNLLEDSDKAISSISKKISEQLKSVPVTKNRVTAKSLVDDLAKQLNEKGAATTVDEVKDIITKLSPQAKGLLQKPSMGIYTANQLRQSIDRTLGDRAFLGGQQTFNKEILKAFNNKLRTEVQKKAPSGTDDLFRELSLEIQLKNSLADKLAQRAGNQVLSFGDFIGGGLGGVFGGIIGQPIAAAGAGVAARRLIESTPAKMIGAKSVEKTIKAIEKIIPILEKLSPLERATLLDAIQTFREE